MCPQHWRPTPNGGDVDHVLVFEPKESEVVDTFRKVWLNNDVSRNHTTWNERVVRAVIIVWHIRPSMIPNWVRPPMVAHSQVGYPPNFPKIAVIELDPTFDAPRMAKLVRLSDDGSYKSVFEGRYPNRRPGYATPTRSLISLPSWIAASTRSNTRGSVPISFPLEI